MKHLISINDLKKDEIYNIFENTKKLKDENKKGIKHHVLSGKTLAMIFTKSSTRTRVSFEAGMYQLGGHALFLSSNDIQLGRGETIEDTAKVLSRYVDGIMIRTDKHSHAEELAQHGSIPVINALTDLLHPCQILADLFTAWEKKGSLEKLKMAYVGDGNNVANSLLYGCSKTGMDISIATPHEYQCSSNVINNSKNNAELSGSLIDISNNPVHAVKDADIIYTDTWVSMGQESEKTEKIKKFGSYQVNKKLFSQAKKDAVFMHCLPAYRNFEVTSDIIDGLSSVVFDEAENRLHVQKAVMSLLMK